MNIYKRKIILIKINYLKKTMRQKCGCVDCFIFFIPTIVVSSNIDDRQYFLISQKYCNKYDIFHLTNKFSFISFQVSFSEFCERIVLTLTVVNGILVNIFKLLVKNIIITYFLSLSVFDFHKYKFIFDVFARIFERIICDDGR